ncbi:hypothetical protein [uncultured Clostridium sp.]|uniref:hypothetical protein n=1 Tax=uncultured Clostridium sp. TaxID=59620 RepID=UPI0028F06C29|nr:hypothetical protein [uncultured Clostridium sp.]
MIKKSNEYNYRESVLQIMDEVQDTYYKPEEISTIRRFIEEYKQENDFQKICFSWNGGRGEEFKDDSQDFRNKISIYICLNNDIKVPPLLLKDLVQEIGKASVESWGAPEYLFLLSERLLKETEGQYIETFGKTLFSNMDTYGSCICMDFSEINVEGILNELNSKKYKDKFILDLIDYFKSKS